MTREKALTLLKLERRTTAFKKREALNLAIEALQKPFIVSAFTSDYEDSAYREFIVFGESNANKIFKEKVETGLYDYVRLDSAIVKDDGMIDYSREGKIKSWISEEIIHWIQQFKDDEKIVPFWVDDR